MSVEPVRIGRYAVGEPLGRGAIGEVRAAFDVERGLPVAVKLLTAESARRPDAAEGFAREVRAVARLQHRAVVRIFDQGALDATASAALGLPAGSPWFSMERARGSAQAGVRDWPALHALLADLLDALAYCHARDLVHRDLKPQNVLRCGAAWKLADFGLAAPLDALDTRIAGTPLYMAPEQFDRPDALGPWTDLYALGCVAWVRATGFPPFLGDVRSLQRAHLTAPLPSFDPQFDVPPGFEAWVRRALAKRPEDRWELAADALQALRELAGDPPAREAEPEPPGAGFGLVGLRELPLVGRADALARLDAAFDDALRGGPPVLVLEGTAGAGKSHLARAFARQLAAQGRARALEVHHAPDDAGEGLADLASRLLRRALRPAAGDARAVLEAWVDFHSPTPPESDRHAALIDVLRALSDRPTLLVCDDLQWGEQTVRFVEALGSGAHLVVATERLEPGRPSALPAGWPRLRVGGLSPADAERLAAEVLGDDGVRAVQLAELSRGNPLLAVQLAVHFAETGRLALSDDPARGWVHRLDAALARIPDAIGALRVAAVLGGEVHALEWERLRDAGGVDALVRMALVEELGDGWRLAHPLLVDAVRSRTSPASWARIAGATADALVDADPLRRARLLLAAGQRDRAAAMALDVRREAADRWDRARAARALELAEEASPAGSRGFERTQIARAQELLARGDLDGARQLAAALPDGPDASHLLGTIAIQDGDDEGAQRRFDLALLDAPDHHGLLHASAYLAVRRGRYARARALLDRLASSAGSAWERAKIERRLAHLALVERRDADALAHARRAEVEARAGGSPGLAAAARHLQAEILLLAGRPAEAEALLREVLERVGRGVDPVARLHYGLALLDTGHPERAAAMLQPFADGRTATIWHDVRALACIALARIRAEHGALDEVGPLLAPGEALAGPLSPEIVRQLAALAALLPTEPALACRVDALRARSPSSR